MREDYYAALGVGPGATQEEIEAAYRKLARRYHPDVNPAPEAAERMRDINAAYRVLRDAERRAEYDRRVVPTRPVSTAATSAARGDDWERFTAWETRRPPASPQPVSSRAPTPPSFSLPLVIGGVLVLLLTGLALVWNTGQSAARVAPSATVSGALASLPTPPGSGPRVATPTNPSGIIAALPPTRTPTPRALTGMPTTPATRTAAPTSSLTPTASATATTTPSPALTATRTPTATVIVTRPAAPPLSITASDFYNEQETRAGGRKFQLKLTILNQGTQVLPPPWRPRFFIMAGDRAKGWVDASYYGPQFGGVDIAQQRPIRPGETHAWSWYVITAGPDEWVRDVEFTGLGWRWTWTFDRAFQNPRLNVGR